MRQIPPFKLVPEAIDATAKALPKFKWASPEIGQRHRLGGDPQFIQPAEWPDCPHCKKKMTFYAQLDSLNDDFCIADCGMIYVFLCFDCFSAESIVQSY